MKIAFDSQIFTTQEYGGVSRYFSSLVENLANIEGVQPLIVAPLHINNYITKLPKNIVSGIKTPRIPKNHKILSWLNPHLSKGVIARYYPQIVHETYYAANTVAPNGVCTVLTVYDMIHELFPTTFPQPNPITKLKRLAAQRADHIMCISENTRKDLLELFDLPAEKVSVTYLGFDNLKPVKLKTKQKPYLLYVGQRQGYKNFKGFLNAYVKSTWLKNNFNIICFGGGKFTNEEKQLYADLKLSDNQLLQLSGNDSQLAYYYSNAAVFVYPSLYEGFGIPPLEAMSLSCPVICSDNSSIPEVVGAAAEYFDPNDSESIGHALINVLKSPTRQADLITMGLNRCNQFTWERCAQDTFTIYKGLI